MIETFRSSNLFACSFIFKSVRTSFENKNCIILESFTVLPIGQGPCNRTPITNLLKKSAKNESFLKTYSRGSAVQVPELLALVAASTSVPIATEVVISRIAILVSGIAGQCASLRSDLGVQAEASLYQN